jgi:CxxC motif-containing protein
LQELAHVVMDAPVEAGQVIVRNIQGTGADIVASRNLAKKVG